MKKPNYLLDKKMEMPSSKKPQFTIREKLWGSFVMGTMLPGCIVSGILVYFSSIMIYQEILAWLKFNASINVSLYYCLTTNSKYCKGIISSIPFDLIPQDFIKWLVYPTDWLGLNSTVVSILKMLPTWLIGYMCAFIIFFGWIYFMIGLFWSINATIHFFLNITKSSKNKDE